MRVIGLAGWSGAGKTTLIVKLIPFLHERGFSVSTLKHAHHAFDVDQPGEIFLFASRSGRPRGSCRLGPAVCIDACIGGAPEPALAELLRRMSPAHLVSIEGFKRDAHVKIEVHREANGKPWLYRDDNSIAAIATDAREGVPAHLPHAHLDDIQAIAGLLLALARPVEETLSRIAGA